MELHELFDKLGYPLTYEKLSDLMLQYDRDESGQVRQQGSSPQCTV